MTAQWIVDAVHADRVFLCNDCNNKLIVAARDANKTPGHCRICLGTQWEKVTPESLKNDPRLRDL